MEFKISFKEGWQTVSYSVIPIVADQRIERFKIEGNGLKMIIESNRPFFRNRGLKSRRPDWKYIEGNLIYQSDLTRFAEAIMKVLEPKMGRF